MAEPTKRQRRVAEQIQQILSELIQFEARDPRLAMVTVTDVTIDRELMYATVYVSAFGEEEDEVLDALGHASGFLRSQMGSQMSLQTVPELRFEWDDSLERAQRINDILDSLDIPSEEPDDDE